MFIKYISVYSHSVPCPANTPLPVASFCMPFLIQYHILLFFFLFFGKGNCIPFMAKYEQTCMLIPLSNDIMLLRLFDSFLFFFPFAFLRTSRNLSEASNWARKLVQCVHASHLSSRWIEGKSLILKFLVFHPVSHC